MEKPVWMALHDLPSLCSTSTNRPATFPDMPIEYSVFSRHVGIEIEVEDCGGKRFRDYTGMADNWSIERDPSLRGDDAYEFKTVFPTNCGQAVLALDHWFNMVASIRKTHPHAFSFSERTSIHIHVDVRDLTLSQVKSLVKLYLVFEKSFFDLVGRDRYHNIFCIPLSQTGVIEGAEGMREFWRSWEKYSALNLVPLAQFGTVEFRAMAGNDNAALIKAWLYIVTCLVEYASLTTTKGVNEIISKLKWESQYEQLARDIFGADLASHLRMFPEASDQAATLAKLF